MPHSIRGKVNGENEGPRYCVACHLTTDSTTPALRASYDTFRSALQPGGNLANLDFNLLRDEIGLNTGNQNNTPYWVHMVAGLGSGLFIFDQNGCPINPLDFDPNRRGCDNPPVAINNNDLANAYFNLDRIVDENGVALGSNNHAIENPGPGGSALRQGSADPFMAGPLGGYLVQLLADPDSGVVLDSWLDADADPGGDAATNMNGP
jgi:hypothetical protein